MKKEAEYLIVGQGIGGILLAFELFTKGKNVVVMDDGNPDATSLSAGALLNPVNLNRGHVFPHQETEWQIALETYHKLESLLDTKFVIPVKLYFFPDMKKNEAYEKISYLKRPPKEDIRLISDVFYEAADALELREVYRIDFHKLKSSWKQFLTLDNRYIEKKFSQENCSFNGNGFLYDSYRFQNIVFAEGVADAANSYFPGLPLIRNQGNILHLRISGLPPGVGFHSDREKLIPMGDKKFWFGSNYVWDSGQHEPDLLWREQSILILKHRLKMPFEIIGHFIAERPTTAGQHPLILQSEAFPNLYLFNGLGTRGFSLGPTLVKEFCQKFSI